MLFELLESRFGLFKAISTHPSGAYGEVVHRVSWGTYTSFNDLDMTFLNHIQLLVHCDAGTELLSTFL